MANDLTGRQWTIDTAAAGLVWRGNIKINSMSFTGYALDTDNFTITDAADRVVWSGNGHDDLSPVEHHDIGWVDGMKVPTLTAGKLTIYIA